MSDMGGFAKRFLGLKSKKEPEASEVSHVNEEELSHATQEIFDVEKENGNAPNLRDIASSDIEKMRELFVIDQSAALDEEMLREDFRDLVKITQEVRGIQKQAILLVGERIDQVREIFCKYGQEKGGFSKWLDMAFNSRKTAYNMLAFYELHQALDSDELRDQLKKMPAKASYILASRNGNLFVKEEIIRNYNGEKQQECLEAIYEQLPIAKEDNRSQKNLGEKTIDDIERLVSVLDRRMGLVEVSQQARIEKLILRLRTLVDAFLVG